MESKTRLVQRLAAEAEAAFARNRGGSHGALAGYSGGGRCRWDWNAGFGKNTGGVTCVCTALGDVVVWISGWGIGSLVLVIP